MSTVRIALAALPYPASPDESVERCTRAIAEAGEHGVDVLCFPESYVPGYRAPHRTVPPLDMEWLAGAWNRVAQAAAAAHVTVILGTERLVAGSPRLTALVIQADGTMAGFQDKVQLDPSEGDFYAPGDERHLFRAGALTFGVAICHEGWRYPETVRWAARRGAQVVFHPHYDWGEPGRANPPQFADPANTFHEKAMLCRAAENTVWFASVNCAEQGATTTSAVAAPDGTLHAWQPYGVDGLLVTDLDLTRATGLLASRCRTVP